MILNMPGLTRYETLKIIFFTKNFRFLKTLLDDEKEWKTFLGL